MVRLAGWHSYIIKQTDFMQFKGKVIDRLPMQSGTSKAGNAWSKATLIVETVTQYPKKVALANMKRAAEFDALPVGTVATFSVDLESREYQGRWYTEVNCWDWALDAPLNPQP